MGQIIQPGFNITDTKAKLIYGPGACILESLQNLRIGNVGRSHDYVASLRFRADRSEQITGIWAYFELASGYATGGGGAIRFRVVDDDGTAQHRPNAGGTVYSEGTYTVSPAHISAGRQIGVFPVTARRAVEAGKLYHVLLDNVAPADTERWASINCPQVRRAYGKPARWFNNTDWAGMYSTNGVNGNWVDGLATGSSGKLFSPMMAIGYSGGGWQGYTPMESGSTDSRAWRLASNSNRIREQYTSQYDRRICGMSLFACCQTAGRMRVLIDINGHRAAEFSINCTAPNYHAEPLGSSTIVNGAWYDVQFPQDVFLPANGTMNLYFVAEGGSVWWLGSMRNASSRGSPVAFNRAETQVQQNGQWVPLNIHNHNGRQAAGDTGMRMVLHVTPPGGDPAAGGGGGGGGGGTPPSASGTFSDLGNDAINVIWVRELPNQTAENRWLIQFVAIRNGGEVINNDQVRNMSAVMADREWSGERTLPAIVWTGGKSLPANISRYTRTQFTVARSNVRSVEPWHDVGIWHANASIANANESQQR